VGYINNIGSDRKLMEYCSDSLAIRLFLRYDIDQALPWHSTISRTRQLYGEEVFLELFRKVLSLCVDNGMVRGKRQAVDSAYVKAAEMYQRVSKAIYSIYVIFYKPSISHANFKTSKPILKISLS
jgi:IS5 family transposase